MNTCFLFSTSDIENIFSMLDDLNLDKANTEVCWQLSRAFTGPPWLISVVVAQPKPGPLYSFISIYCIIYLSLEENVTFVYFREIQ